MLKPPEASATAVRSAPVSTLLAEIAAFGITAPWESRTVPRILPVTVCANDCGAFTSENMTTTSTPVRIGILQLDRCILPPHRKPEFPPLVLNKHTIHA